MRWPMGGDVADIGTSGVIRKRRLRGRSGSERPPRPQGAGDDQAAVALGTSGIAASGRHTCAALARVPSARRDGIPPASVCTPRPSHHRGSPVRLLPAATSASAPARRCAWARVFGTGPGRGHRAAPRRKRRRDGLARLHTLACPTAPVRSRARHLRRGGLEPGRGLNPAGRGRRGGAAPAGSSVPSHSRMPNCCWLTQTFFRCSNTSLGMPSGRSIRL